MNAASHQIVAASAAAFGVAVAELQARGRSGRISRCRMGCALLLRWLISPTGQRRSWERIAVAMGRSDHATAKYQGEAAMALAASDPAFQRALCAAVADLIGGGLISHGDARLPEGATALAARIVADRPIAAAASGLPRNQFYEPGDGHVARMQHGSAQLRDMILWQRVVAGGLPGGMGL